MNRAISAWRRSPVGARRIDEGCTVAVTKGASGECTNVARWVLTRNFGPMTCFIQRFVEQSARRPDERAALEILAVPGLLAHEHRSGLFAPLAEDRLRPGFPEIARLAACGGEL